MPTNEELLLAWRDDPAAGDELCKRLIDPLYAFFRTKVDRGAEDLVQKTLTAFLEGRDRFAGRSSVLGYVFGIARNILLAALRARYDGQREVDFGSDSIEDLQPSPSSVAAQRQTQARLTRALRRLPADQYMALELFYWQGLTATAVGEALGISEGGVRSRLHRAKAALREQLENDGASADEVETTMSRLEANEPPDEPA